MTRRKFNTNDYKKRDVRREGAELAIKSFNSRRIADEKIDEYIQECPKASDINIPVCDKLIFYSVEDLMKETGWSKDIVLRMFNLPEFPSADYGKRKVVEHNALIKFFSVKHSKREEGFRRGMTYGM